MVPVTSILFMFVSLVIAVGLPFLLYHIFKRRFEMRIPPVLLGIAGFILFAMVLEQLLHMAVLRPDASGNMALKAKPALYIIYGCLAAGVFEETARFIAFHILKRGKVKAAAKADSSAADAVQSAKTRRNVGEALSYGIGHGCTEAVLLLGVSMIANIIAGIMINMGMSAILEKIPVLAPAIHTLPAAPPYIFLVGSVERIFAVTIQISLSVVVWAAVYARGKAWLYPAAILLHALADVPAAMMQVGILKSVALVEAIVGISAVITAIIAVFTYKRLKDEITNEAGQG